MSYLTILSVVDENTTSTVTARYAISLAAECKAELVLYAAHIEMVAENKRHLMERHLEHLHTIASELNIPVRCITEIGNINMLLPKRAQEVNADLVMYSLTPDEQYGEVLKRHTVHHLLRSVKSDLAIMRVVTMSKPHPRHILVPLGKVVSDNGRRLMFVTELAKSYHSHITPFHLSTAQTPGCKTEEITPFQKVSTRGGRGKIGTQITVEAITRHNDLIVLGVSERSLLRRLFFGNPAGDVMQQPPCNAIMFRAAH
jgi:nucleotide-binding universal stress UspA family protein